MTPFLEIMWAPLAACLVLTWIHAYLGMHVLQREIIFVDLSLAQIAALGTILALLLGLDMHSWQAYWLSLSATFLGATLFALTRTRYQRVPQEAVIGIVYVVSAALAVLILHGSPEGDEHIQHMLVGNILLVSPEEVLKMAVLYGAIGAVHWIFRKPLILISGDPGKAREKGLPLRLWDLLFYGTFGIVVTSSVEVAGVLLVFSFLIMPAVAAKLFFRAWPQRLLFGWGFGMAASAAGILLSYIADWPTGATLVSTFGAFLALLACFKKLRGRGV
jgi:zinc/manganese transport system permease protein